MPMTRRAFLHNIFKFFRSSVTASLFPMLTGCRKGEVAPAEGTENTDLNGLTLKEIARNKIHHGPDRYISPFTRMDYGGRLPSVLKWKLTPSSFKHLFPKEKVASVTLDWPTIYRDTGLSITYLNHASILIQDQGTRILVDPIFFGLSFFIKDFTPLKFQGAAVPSVDHILITHGHYDHLDKKTLNLFPKNTHVVTPLGYDNILRGMGLAHHSEMDWYDTIKPDNIEVTLLPCHHWSMRNPFVGANRRLWGSYLLKTRSGPTIFISGDTAYFDRIKEIGEAFDIDLAIFNLGAYEPRWMMKESHMSPRETVAAVKALRARHFTIVHWGTFRLGDEPVFLPPAQLAEELSRQGLSDRYLPLPHGETLYYGEEMADNGLEPACLLGRGLP